MGYKTTYSNCKAEASIISAQSTCANDVLPNATSTKLLCPKLLHCEKHCAKHHDCRSDQSEEGGDFVQKYKAEDPRKREVEITHSGASDRSAALEAEGHAALGDESKERTGECEHEASVVEVDDMCGRPAPTGRRNCHRNPE